MKFTEIFKVHVLNTPPPVPGADAGITHQDWVWLQKECHVYSDWELGHRVSCNPRDQVTTCTMRLGFAGRIARPKKPDKLEFRLEEQSPYNRADATFGRRAWSYRARVAPWRQRPEWEFNDADAHSSWRRVDATILAQTPPCAFAHLAEQAVSALGRWPEIKPHTPVVEKRLAACLHAVLAYPRFYGAECGSDASESWGRIHRVWQRVLSDGPMESQMDSEGIATLLRNIGMGVPPMEATRFFRHAPAQNMVEAIHSFRLIRKSPLFHGMELSQTCETNDDKEYEWTLQNRPGHDNDGGVVWGPKGRLFMFQQHFAAYNQRGMSAEDPQAFRWRPEKLLVDYTPIVTVADCIGAFLNVEYAERRRLQSYRKLHNSPQGFGRPMKIQEIREEWNAFGPDAMIWDMLGVPVQFAFCWDKECPEHRDNFETLLCTTLDIRPCIGCAHNSLYSKRTLFWPTGSEMGRVDPSLELFHRFLIEWPLSPGLAALQWIGGTYAAHAQFFPREQLSATWIREHLLPLAIEPPTRFQRFMGFNAKRYLCSHGPDRDFYAKQFPGIAAIDTLPPLATDITNVWQKKYDWFTVPASLYVPDKTTAAGRDKDWIASLSQLPDKRVLHCDSTVPSNKVPARTALANSVYVSKFL